MTEQGIRIEAVDYAVAGRTILSGIDLHLGERRIGIIGQNGSGKTTLLRLMAGLIAPSRGRVRIAGGNPDDRRAMLAQVGILFQSPDHQILFPTVEEELAFGLRQMGQSRSEAAAAITARLAAEGRDHWAGLSTQALSQGQKQYLCLLAVLMMTPRIILLDEPFAALDLPTRARLVRRLAGLPQQLITISHDPASVADCDRIIWLEGGRVVGDGTPGQVLPAFEAEMARLGREGPMLSLVSPVATPWHRLPAGLKLAGMCLGSVALFTIGSPWVMLAPAGAVALAYLACGPVFAAHGLRMLRPLWPFLLVIALWHGWSGDLRGGALIGLRLVTAVGLANLVTMTTRLDDIVAVVERLCTPLARFGLPPRLPGLAVGLVIRFIPVTAERMARLREAWRARAIRPAGWRIALPATLGALDDAEQVAQALRARGGAG